ncbi:MAG: porin [Pigmentiphaga sp.]|nr:porin [Pigmentiphaga sp.]
MKKSLLAAALLAGFAGAAQAQSVTLYGQVDAGFVYDKTDGQSAIKGINSGVLGSSRFGLRGSEDLGNGLKANFQLENGFSADTGADNASFFDRAAWVGLSGGFGEVRLGHQDSLGFNWFRGAVNPFGNAYLQGQSATVFNVNGTADRFSNSVFYHSPKFSGFQFGAGYSFNVAGGEAAGSSNNNDAYSLGLRYNQGPLLAVATYEEQDSTAAQAGSARKNFQIGAAYDFNVVKLHAGFGLLKNANYVSASEDQKSYLLGISAPLGAGKIKATYQRVDNANVNRGRPDSSIDGFAVGYDYALSKRTVAYALFNQYSDVGFVNGRLADRKQFSIGLQHKF